MEIFLAQGGLVTAKSNVQNFGFRIFNFYNIISLDSGAVRNDGKTWMIVINLKSGDFVSLQK